MGHRLPLFLVLALALSIALHATMPVGAQEGEQRAGLVVIHGDGQVVTRCVSFSEPQISGVSLLQRSGLALTSATGPTGVTVCALNGEGCPASDCWCECRGVPCAYWIYFQRAPDGAWAYGTIGAALRRLGDGDVDAWVWGDGSTMPPAVSFETICGAEAPAATAAPTAASAEGDEAEVAVPETAIPPTDIPSTATPTTEAEAATVIPTQTSTPLSSPTASPVAAPSSTPDDPTPSPTVVVDAPATPDLAPEPTAEPPAPTPELSAESGGVPPAYLGFLMILGVIGVAFALLRRK